MMIRILLPLLALAPFIAAPATAQTKPSSPKDAATTAATTRPHNFARWEKAIAAFEAEDEKNAPPKNAILFVGSSTIRGWKTLKQDFPEHAIINRGFGGSQIVDATHFADRIVTKYEPKMIFFRSGGNDINAGKPAEQVFRDFQAFCAKVHEKLPTTDIVFISWAPAPVRWDERHENKKLNDLVQAWAKTTPHVKYVETYNTTVNADGSPREELFIKDRLHFNAEGYKLLAERVRPILPPP